MNRLTKKIDGSVVFPNQLVEAGIAPDNETICALLKRLSAYEDTGLTPEEIEATLKGE